LAALRSGPFAFLQATERRFAACAAGKFRPSGAWLTGGARDGAAIALTAKTRDESRSASARAILT